MASSSGLQGSVLLHALTHQQGCSLRPYIWWEVGVHGQLHQHPQQALLILRDLARKLEHEHVDTSYLHSMGGCMRAAKVQEVHVRELMHIFCTLPQAHAPATAHTESNRQ